MNKMNFFITGAILFFLVVGCGSMMKGKKQAESAVEKFHSQYNAKQYSEIYSQTDDGFKKVVSEKQWTELMEKVQRKLGTVNKSSSAGWKVNTTTDGTFATVTYNIDFSNGAGTEEFIFRISDDQVRLYNYKVDSPVWNNQ